MIKTKTFAIAFCAITLFSCNDGADKNSSTSNSGKSSATTSGDLYFDYTIDGKEMHVNVEDISSSYTANKTDTIFHLDAHAAKEGEPALLLTVPHDMTKPSTTPSGSPDSKMNIMGGSATLLNVPEKNYTSLSYNSSYPEKSPVIADAIVITSSEKQGEEARIITGTFNFKTYGENKETDPKQTDHVIKGKFRIKHKLSDGVM